MNINPLTAIDFYKADHRSQYPKGTTEVYANFTPRSNRLANMPKSHDDKIVFFGLQYFIKDFLIESWDIGFFSLEKNYVVERYKKRMSCALGDDAITYEHIEQLHDLGYLPISIKALPEGSRVPMGVPVLTIVNTHPDFFWLTNYIETIISCYLWKPITSATIAFEYKKIFIDFCERTGGDKLFVNFQAHDFSFRGLSGPQDAAMSGAAHLTSFSGTDSVPAIDLIEDYYNADAAKEPIGFSVPATEHSVMCMGTKENEIDTFRRLINETYPKGIVSIVSDTWDFWKVITEYVLVLKADILRRDGKVVIRPDSGDPVKIICGDSNAAPGTPEYKGAIECLWDIFGGTETDTGHKQLDSHIGLIYGDSITLDRAERILSGLADKGFCSSNVILGVGSFTYQYVTRDTFGFAMKATSGIVNGERRDIFKAPKTDSGDKKSAKGLLRVDEDAAGNYFLLDNQTEAEEEGGHLKEVYRDGVQLKDDSFSNIRAKIDQQLA